MTSDDSLTHLDETGAAHMVDVGGKAVTERLAVAVGAVLLAPATLTAVITGNAPKGDVFGAARLAGIMAAKRTADLIPLCHPLSLTSISVELEPVADAAADPRVPWVPGQPTAAVAITASAGVTGRTGVEMEALTAVCVAALTLYDMAKALDKAMVITGTRLHRKSGGRSEYTAATEGAMNDDWKTRIREVIEGYGHRNWIVVADSAFPMITAGGVEMLVSRADQDRVVEFVAKAIAEAPHVQANVFVDEELAALDSVLPAEQAEALQSFRSALAMAGAEPQPVLHETLIDRLNAAGRDFRVLLIKTTSTLPYTTVFFELDCGYWDAAREAALRQAMRPAK